jgi:hypothetical protein
MDEEDEAIVGDTEREMWKKERERREKESVRQCEEKLFFLHAVLNKFVSNDKYPYTIQTPRINAFATACLVNMKWMRL